MAGEIGRNIFVVPRGEEPLVSVGGYRGKRWTYEEVYNAHARQFIELARLAGELGICNIWFSTDRPCNPHDDVSVGLFHGRMTLAERIFGLSRQDGGQPVNTIFHGAADGLQPARMNRAYQLNDTAAPDGVALHYLYTYRRGQDKALATARYAKANPEVVPGDQDLIAYSTIPHALDRVIVAGVGRAHTGPPTLHEPLPWHSDAVPIHYIGEPWAMVSPHMVRNSVMGRPIYPGS
jgi:hypothetical protein